MVRRHGCAMPASERPPPEADRRCGPRVTRSKAGQFVIAGRPVIGDERHPDYGWALPPGHDETWKRISTEEWPK